MNFTEALTGQLMTWTDETTWLSVDVVAEFVRAAVLEADNLADLRAMLTVTYCRRCGRKMQADDAEVCWYCSGDLCGECWERYGHCGHPEADAINERMRAWLAEWERGDK
jgi:hypothetical protein